MTDKKTMVTERDLEILRWVNRNKYATAEQIMKSFKMNRAVAYKRLQGLVRWGFMVYERVLHIKKGVYRVTNDGAGLAGDSMIVKNIRYATFIHDLTVVDLSIELKELTGGTWITERELWLDKGPSLKNVKDPHVPDGVLIVNNRKYAVELQLSPRSKKRAEDLLRRLFIDGYKDVWYFVQSGAIGIKFLNTAAQMSNMKMNVRAFKYPGIKEIKISGPGAQKPNSDNAVNPGEFFKRRDSVV